MEWPEPDVSSSSVMQFGKIAVGEFFTITKKVMCATLIMFRVEPLEIYYLRITPVLTHAAGDRLQRLSKLAPAGMGQSSRTTECGTSWKLQYLRH